ncbi:HD domain-containing protein [Halomarina oriensis]|uniref:HD domain-containing protein n=1 Tax=Halomarina oriensis TaxID=671145 RepID=A0A6B0GPT6_9EURY|nr:HD domain-containing protein [Halomarina oriensis]MWG34673.1 HD domain-containing protein [Halomarina oriensis]
MLSTLRERAQPFFADAAPAHDWHHVERVDRLATRLADDHTETVDRDVLHASVYCHDVGREREARGDVDDHAVWAAEQVPDLLADLADGATVERVVHCVRAHRYSASVEPETVEAELLCDADNLDAMGAVGIGRTFAHGGALGEPMHGSDDPRSGGQLAHLRGKISSLRDRMYTDPGRELAAERHAVVEEFVEQFEAELSGDR